MIRYPNTDQNPEQSRDVPPSVRSRLNVTSASELFINAATDAAYREHLLKESARQNNLETKVPSLAMNRMVDYVPPKPELQTSDKPAVDYVSESADDSSVPALTGQVMSDWDLERKAMMEKARQEMQNGFNN